MRDDLGSLEEMADHDINDTIGVGKLYLELVEVSFRYEVNLYEKIVMLKDLTNSAGMVLYLVDQTEEYLQFRQEAHRRMVHINIKIGTHKNFKIEIIIRNLHSKKLNINFIWSIYKFLTQIYLTGPDGPLSATVAHFKKDFLIEDPVKFIRSHENIKLDLEIFKNCIYCFPVFDSFNKVLAVIEIYRNDGGSYMSSDTEYMTEFAIWFGCALQQSRLGSRQCQTRKIHEIFSDMLFMLVTEQQKHLNHFLFSILKYCKEVIECEFVLYYDLMKTDGTYSLYVAKIYTIDESSLKLLIQRLNLHKGKSNICEDVIRSSNVLNLQITSSENETRTPKLIKNILKNPIICNELYVPISSYGVTIGVISLINSKRNPIFKNSDVDFLKIASLYIVSAEHFKKVNTELETENAKLAIAEDNLEYQLTKPIVIPDDCNPNIEIPEKFMNYQFHAYQGMELLSYMYYMIEDLCPNFFYPDTLKKCLLSAKNCHKNLPFFNFEQAFLQFHLMYLILKHSPEIELTIEEKAPLLLYCAFKYVYHSGLNNETVELIHHPLTKITSKMYTEKNSLMICLEIIEHTKLLKHFSEEIKKRLTKLLARHLTDPANIYTSIFKSHLEKHITLKSFQVNGLEQRTYIKNLIMWCSTNARYLQVYDYARKLCENFYMQNSFIGDIQKKLKLKDQVDDEYDTEAIYKLAENEYKKMEKIVLPVFRLLAKVIPNCYELVELCTTLLHAFQLKMITTDKKLWLIDDSYESKEDSDEISIAIVDDQDIERVSFRKSKYS